MTCADRIFVSTDIVIPVTFTGVLAADISDLYVKFSNRNDPTIYKSYLYSTGGITISGETINIIVDKTHITVPGIYDIYMKRTSQAGKLIGVVPCPGWVNFYQML